MFFVIRRGLDGRSKLEDKSRNFYPNMPPSGKSVTQAQ